MAKKILFFIVLLPFVGAFNIALSEIIPLKKPSQSKEETQKKLSVDVLKPLPKPIEKTETKKIEEKKEEKIVVKKEKKNGLILPKKKPLIAGSKKKPDVKISGNNSTASVTGLAKGLYTICFKVDGEPDYEQCFDVLIEEPEPISAYIDIDVDNRTSSFELRGSSNYNIDINGTIYKVDQDRFTASLPTGLNIIKVYTDLECQGVIEKEVFISEDIMFYPNPTYNDVNVHVSGMDKNVMVSIFSEKGDLVAKKEQQVQDLSRLVEIDLTSQSTGIYIVVMEGKTVRKTFKIVKK